MTRNTVKIGVIGLGRMGQNHLRVLSMLKNVEIIFVFDTNEEVSNAVALTFGVKPEYKLDTALKKVDAVIIASPTYTHADYVRQAARYVRNILVEKPIAHTLAEAEALWNLAQKDNLNIQVGFIERFNPAIHQLKNVIYEAAKVISIDFTRTNKLSARIIDVDVITDLMIHDIDLSIYLNGPIQSIRAHGFIQDQMIDFASALLTHTNGQFSRILASRITDKKIRSVQATCSDMYVDCDLLRKEIIISRQTETVQRSNGPYVINSFQEAVEVRPHEALLAELQTFLSSCKGESVDRPDALAGLQAMHICHQIQESIFKTD